MELATDNDFEIINGRKIIKKHVATIHCSNSLSLLERKISNALLYNAFPSLKKNLIHEITLEQLKRLLNIKTRNHIALKAALKKLITTLIEWNVLGEEVPELEGWNSSTILSSVSVLNGVVKYQYSELIKTLIIDPKIYGRINLIIQARFKSSYALALYENCARYRGLKYTKDFSLSEFRMLMGLEENKYELYKDLNRRVLTPAVTEINTCSDIRVTPDITKKGKKIISIKFLIEERKMKNRFLLNENIDTPESIKNKINRLSKELSIESSSLNKFYQEYGEVKVDKAIEYVRTLSTFKMGGIKNIGGYIKTTLENNYDQVVLKNDISEANQEESKKDLNVELKQEYFDSYLPDKLYKVYQKLPECEKEKIEKDFINNGRSYHKSLFSTAVDRGTKDIFIFLQGLSNFIYAKYPSVVEKILSLEDYVRSKSQ